MRFLLVALLMAVAPVLAAGSATGRLDRDLGLGLAYTRVRALPADLPPAPAKPAPIVLDLRYATGDESAATALGAWLQFRAAVRTPVFVLVNPATATAILDFLEHNPPRPGLVTLGSPSSRFVPDLPLKVSALTERAAYDALDQGATLENLLTDQPAKPRRDEAVIAQEHAVSPEAVDDAGSDLSDTPEPATPPVPPPLIDATLQRAVQLHRALLALRKI